jgi:hypothetical protein
MNVRSSLLIPSLLLAAATADAQTQSFRFREVAIDPAAAKKTCYAVVLADVDSDGDQDIVVVNENRVQWYESPTWEKHVILEDQTELDNVSIAPYDIDNDGQVDFALAAGWTKIGTIQWITRGEKPEDKWSVHAIAVEPWTHRLRWANVLGKDRPQLVVSPLNATSGPGVKLTAFEIPKDPRTDRWPATVIDDTLNRMHNHWHVDFDADGVDSTITASDQGLHLFSLNDDRGFTHRKIGSGIPGDKPETSGAGEVKIGKLGNGRPFMATVEPMHGHAVAVYTVPGDKFADGQLADRLVLDESLGQGHAVWCANLDADPADELVVGHREPGTGEIKGPGVYVYDSLDDAGTKWSKHVIDNGGMACEDLLCADLTGDGKIDIVAVGRKTLNVKLYVNE